MAERVEEWARHRPPAALRPYVAGYSGFRQRGVPPARHAGLPSPYLTVILTLDEPLVVERHPDPSQPPARYDALIGGLHARPATVVHDGAQSGVQVALSPLGARALLGLPAGELAGLDVAADAVLGPVAARWSDAVRRAGTWPQRFAALDAVLLHGLASHRLRGGVRPAFAVHPTVARAWQVILSSGGCVGVAALADEVALGERHLRDLFDREIGLSPKQACRVVRFDRARRLVMAGALAGDRRGTSPPPSLADIAASCGYADHAHLVRDFREFAGAPPSQWLGEELRNLQAPPDPLWPEWTS